jgi:type IX secretion system PorP/SprF family membrane protein
MSKSLKYSIFIFLNIIMSISLKAQDPSFSQYYANKLYFNPAFAGTTRCPTLNLHYRNQWPLISGTYVTYSASLDAHVPVCHGGVGMLVTSDRSGKGLLSTTNVGGMYSYEATLARELSIKMALQATYVQKSVDWSKIIFGDMIDPQYGYVYTTKEEEPIPTVGFADFSAGILGFGTHYYFGAAIHHLTEPDEGFLKDSKSRLPKKFTVHGGAVILLDRAGHNKLYPSILYQRQAEISQYNFGLYTKLNDSFVGGLWYRMNDSFIVLMGIEQKSFTFGFSYDITVSKLSMRTAGAMECSVSYIFGCRPEKKKLRPINCPSF